VHGAKHQCAGCAHQYYTRVNRRRITDTALW
jgi:hypothetical protein